MSDIKPGTILVHSWGYDQTQVDFYQVVALKGKASCVVVKLPAVRVQDTSWASDKVIAGEREDDAPEATCRIIRGAYVSLTKLGMQGYSAGIWDGSPRHRSWYA